MPKSRKGAARRAGSKASHFKISKRLATAFIDYPLTPVRRLKPVLHRRGRRPSGRALQRRVAVATLRQLTALLLALASATESAIRGVRPDAGPLGLRTEDAAVDLRRTDLGRAEPEPSAHPERACPPKMLSTASASQRHLGDVAAAHGCERPVAGSAQTDDSMSCFKSRFTPTPASDAWRKSDSLPIVSRRCLRFRCVRSSGSDFSPFIDLE